METWAGGRHSRRAAGPWSQGGLAGHQSSTWKALHKAVRSEAPPAGMLIHLVLGWSRQPSF